MNFQCNLILNEKLKFFNTTQFVNELNQKLKLMVGASWLVLYSIMPLDISLWKGGVMRFAPMTFLCHTSSDIYQSTYSTKKVDSWSLVLVLYSIKLHRI